MEFSFTEDQDLLRMSFNEYLRSKCTSDDRKEWLTSQNGFSVNVWRDMAELGWLGLIYDEKYGGMGGSFLELFILFEEIGKFLLPSPLFATVLAGMLIDKAGNEGQKEKYLPAIIKGKQIFTLAYLDQQGTYDGNSPKVKAMAVDDNLYCLEGIRLLVSYANVADKILLCANLANREQTGPTMFLVNSKTNGLHLTPLETISVEKEYAVLFEKVRASETDIVGQIGKGNSYIDWLLPKAMTLKCAEMIGGLRQVVDMTVDYAKKRSQFGRPLGSLQIVQHYCADMMSYLEAARLLAYQAATLLSDEVPCTKELAMAKAWCSDAYTRCCLISHQIHGAMGFSEEYDLHLYFKHAKASELMFGHSWFHRSKVADELGL
jgi:alkylation response protein AidB-like acyl-CoA dehydrogenase